MRPEIWAVTALLIVPMTGQQRGVVNGVAVPKTPVQAGLPVDITITGTNPCGAVRVDPGDGTERITHPTTQVPTTVRYVYRKAGRFEVRAEGMFSELLPGVLSNLHVTSAAGRVDVITFLGERVFARIPDHGWAAFAHSISFTAVCFLPVWLLYRRRIFLKV